MRNAIWTVTYRGFLQVVCRTFATRKRAVQWVRQVGKEREATITRVPEA